MLQARGSLEELQDDLNVCKDEGYLSESKINELKNKSHDVHRLLNGYIRHLRSRKDTAPSTAREDEAHFNSPTL
jgi:hypothetical protein